MNKSIEISVVVNTCNFEKYIKKCMNSILSQTFDLNKVEILVIDDCSDDETLKILDWYSKKHKNIKVIKSESHIGNQAIVKNLGIHKAVGKYITFLDGDDYFAKTALADLYTQIEEDKINLVLGGLVRVTKKKNIIPWDYKQPFMQLEMLKTSVTENPKILSVLLHKFVGLVNTSFLRESEIKFNEELPIYCSEAFVKQVLIKAKTFSYMPNLVYNYRVRNQDKDVSLSHVHSYEISHEVGKLDAILYEYCQKLNVIKSVYGAINYILVRNAIFRLDYDFNKLPEELKEEVLINYLNLMKRANVYSIRRFNKLSTLIIKLINEENYEQAISLLSVKLSKEYYEERLENLKGRDVKLENVKKSKSWIITSPIRMVKKMYTNIKEQISNPLLLICYFMTKSYYGKKNIWLIGERNDQAEDNGYHLFKYCRTHRPDLNLYYIIDKDAKQLENVKSYGNIIYHSSFKHKLMMLHAKVYISAYHFLTFSFPRPGREFQKKFAKYINAKEVFLQHGVYIHDVSKWTFKEKNPYDLFITSSEYERQYVIKELGYEKQTVKNVGLSRFDNLYKNDVKREILIMPTWRDFLRHQSRKQFVYSEYYRRYNDLINDSRFIEMLERYDLKVNFYIHSEMQRFIDLFNFENERIVIHTKQQASVQNLLKENSLLITDYSSVSADFLYMDKAVILYQFDPEKFHYRPSEYIRYRDMGKVVNEKELVLDELEKFIQNDFKLNAKQSKKAKEIFNVRDRNNCYRTIKSIEEMEIRAN
ncbi:CDP-glycerol glycerophosphotransferase family protein [Bacillus mycoides]|uniref:bifunctional glycosyltransferase/CDP-glycerol:glycerophosphate glycerophosphotransferase n=1 Tax=Bacillus mycoides TaxID=1405 RepID=UPI002E1E1F7A|nr:CDP-glycerol glycerophosphotransferase family protein [Bacillus mycoides]MED1283647.1 CDP-glycerol glycerophosphotransferase family protein [Bacillus mycoides]